jgi:hypothetical protein
VCVRGGYLHNPTDISENYVMTRDVVRTGLPDVLF